MASIGNVISYTSAVAATVWQSVIQYYSLIFKLCRFAQVHKKIFLGVNTSAKQTLLQ